MRGRYPAHDVMARAPLWDDATRRVIEKRLEKRERLEFFTPDEVPTAQALCDSVTGQHGEARIPVVEMIDEKLAARRFDGFRYVGMPDDDETWRLALRGLEEVAKRRYSMRFADCPSDIRHAICQQFSDGTMHGGAFDCIDCKRAWSVVTRGILAAFYSHPWAWNEIGFPGPAYPRGYMRLGEGLREPRESKETQAPDPVRESEAGRR
jgi:Gluconate 2-dehydrogenase subunit 3